MERPTPYYSYDGKLLRQTLDAAKEAIKSHPAVGQAHIHFAIKANNNPMVLKTIASAGLGADCVSGGEIRQALDAGFKACDIAYAGVGKTDAEIKMALEAGIGCFNVESVEELEIISEISAGMGLVAPIALRINPNVGAHTHANITTGLAENKFGINLEKVPEAVEKAKSLPGIKLKGMHFHIGSQILEMDDFKALCNRINELQEWFRRHGVKLETINVGGGLGIDYEHPHKHPVPDFNAYFGTFAKHLKLEAGQELHCELGRAIVGQCGSLITRCIYVKNGTFKKFVIVDAGMNDLIRPALYHAFHLIENISNPDAEQCLYDVVGPICESSDCFAKGIYLPETKRGDIIAIRSAGAYGESMASTYNSRPLVESEFIL